MSSEDAVACVEMWLAENSPTKFVELAAQGGVNFQDMGVGVPADKQTTEYLAADDLANNEDDTQPEFEPIHKALADLEEDTTASELEDFHRVRWQFMAPVLPFEKNVLWNFSDHVVIPVREFEAKGDGGFSDVFRVKFHPAHWAGQVCCTFMLGMLIRPQSTDDYCTGQRRI